MGLHDVFDQCFGHKFITWSLRLEMSHPFGHSRSQRCAAGQIQSFPEEWTRVHSIYPLFTASNDRHWHGLDNIHSGRLEGRGILLAAACAPFPPQAVNTWKAITFKTTMEVTATMRRWSCCSQHGYAYTASWKFHCDCRLNSRHTLTALCHSNPKISQFKHRNTPEKNSTSNMPLMTTNAWQWEK